MDTITLIYADGGTDYSREFEVMAVKGFLPGDGVVTYPNLQPNLLSGKRERYSIGFSRVFNLDFGVIQNAADARFLSYFLTKSATNKKTSQRLSYNYWWSITGTVSSSGVTVTGTGTLFTEELIVGSVIRSPDGQNRVVDAITSNTVLTVSTAFSSSLSGAILSIYVAELELPVTYLPEEFENTWKDGSILGRQFSIPLIEKDIRTAYPTGAILLAKAAAFDGSTEYASKSSPANLDMNGAELITDSDDADFETNVGNWVGASDHGGNHEISRTATNPLAGTGSGLIAASGAGVRATDYVDLPASAFTALVSGTNYTIQVLANSDTATTTLTLAIGASGQTKVSGTLSTTPGTGTLIVFNFTAGANDVGQELRLFANKAANVRIDSVSITVAYDFTILARIKAPQQTSSYPSIVEYRPSSSLSIIELSADQNTNQKMNIYLNDGINAVNPVPNYAVFDDTWKFIALCIDRDVDLKVFLDAVLLEAPAISTIGKLSGSATLYIGRNVVAGINFKGIIGEIQLIRGYAMTAAEILDYFNTGIKSTPPGGTVVAHYKWRGASDATFLSDESASNNDLTGTNLTQAADQVAAYYMSSEE